MATLELNHLTKRFGAFTAVNGLELQAADGEMIALLGGSGCGKTTTLRMIAGFLDPDAGTILVNGRDVSKIPPYKRNIGIFFQNYALFPNMTVLDNVMYALNLKLKNKEEAKKQALKMIKVVNMEEHIKKYPHELSGGQQQRVAIARAIAKNPSLLLCDEPTGALDYQTGKKVLKILQDRSLKKNSTVIIVTHNAALAPIADKVIRIQDGKIKQIENNSSPQDIAKIEW